MVSVQVNMVSDQLKYGICYGIYGFCSGTAARSQYTGCFRFAKHLNKKNYKQHQG